MASGRRKQQFDCSIAGLNSRGIGHKRMLLGWLNRRRLLLRNDGGCRSRLLLLLHRKRDYSWKSGSRLGSGAENRRLRAWSCNSSGGGLIDRDRGKQSCGVLLQLRLSLMLLLLLLSADSIQSRLSRLQQQGRIITSWQNCSGDASAVGQLLR